MMSQKSKEIRHVTEEKNTEYREIADRLNSERDLVRKRLALAMDCFYQNPSEELLKIVFGELIYAVIYRIELHVPIEFENNGISYKLMKVPEFGWLYEAYSSAEELNKSSEDTTAVIQTRKMFELVLADNLAGLMIDPHHESEKGAMLFLRKENIEAILKYADETIAAQPAELRKVLSGE